MPLTVITKDIITTDVEALVISASPFVKIGPGLDYKVYALAGKENLLEERKKIGKIKKGDAAITSGLSSKFKYIIHTVVPSWYDGSANEVIFLTRCYRNALSLAEQHKITSIAFPLLGTGRNYIPNDVAMRIATNTIDSWLNSHHNNLDVFLVLHPRMKSLSPEKDSLPLSLPTTSFGSPQDILRNNIHNQKHAADVISYSASSLSRLIKGEITSPKKNTVLSLAIYMNLPKEVRIHFITSFGHSYPVDARDNAIEDLITKGYSDFATINNLLYEKNTAWTLTVYK